MILTASFHNVFLHFWCIRHTDWRNYFCQKHLSWWLLSHFHPVRSFPSFLKSPKDSLTIEYHVHIRRVSSELSYDAVTPVKYICDSTNLTVTFAKSKILLTEKIKRGALVKPTPGHCMELIFVTVMANRIYVILLNQCCMSSRCTRGLWSRLWCI